MDWIRCQQTARARGPHHIDVLAEPVSDADIELQAQMAAQGLRVAVSALPE